MTDNPNIHKTRVDTIRQQVDDMMREVEGTSVEELDESELEYKYKHLFKTSKTLFLFILKNAKSNKENFKQNVDMMLSLITRIQANDLTQHDASVAVGKELAEQFIPQVRDSNSPRR